MKNLQSCKNKLIGHTISGDLITFWGKVHQNQYADGSHLGKKSTLVAGAFWEKYKFKEVGRL